jgi:aminocarboxymuconate-semialdehyde decarboxylase
VPMKIDCHAHIMPAHWPDLKYKFGYGGFIYLDHDPKTKTAKMMRDDGKFFRKVEENCFNPEAILWDMSANQVDQMVLCTVPVLFNYWAKPNDAAWWSSFLNDHIAEVQSQRPDKFIALGTLPMQDIALSIKELERLKTLNVKGVQIGSNINNVNLDDDRFLPLYAAMQDLDMALFVHPWEMMGEEFTQKFWLPWLVGMPAETSRAVCSMIFGGIFDKFPNLRVMFAHAGGSFPFTLGRIAHGWAVRPDLVNLNDVKNPKDYIGKFWVDGITHDTKAFDYLLDMFGSEKICYGTDYPFPLGDLEHGAFIANNPNISDTDKRNIFSESVKQFLKL